MFGLKVPLTKDLFHEEFDDVKTILSQSKYQCNKGDWRGNRDNRKEIFFLEVKYPASYKHIPCCCVSITSEDTGYCTDESPVLSYKIPFRKAANHCKICTAVKMTSEVGKELKMSSIDINANETMHQQGYKTVKVLPLLPKSSQKKLAADIDLEKKHAGIFLFREMFGILLGTDKSKSLVVVKGKVIFADVSAHNANNSACADPLYEKVGIGDILASIDGNRITARNFNSIMLNIKNEQEKDNSLATLLFKSAECKEDKSPVISLSSSVSPEHPSADVIACVNATEKKSLQDCAQFTVVYINLSNLRENVSEDDIVYQYPERDSTLIETRGLFITLQQIISEMSIKESVCINCQHSQRKYTASHHKEEKELLVVIFPKLRSGQVTIRSITEDLVRILRVLFSSLHEAFTCLDNRKELDSLFSLLNHSMGLSSSKDNASPPSLKSYNILDNFYRLRMPQFISMEGSLKTKIDDILTFWESADFLDMSESYYGCRRLYTILGSCVFYKNIVTCNHLPKDDLRDVYLYLCLQQLLNLSHRDLIHRLVLWREVHPTRQCYDFSEEQMFGYTEPVSARWFWLIVGVKNLIFCTLIESSGYNLRLQQDLDPDPFYIDQAQATLMQIQHLFTNTSTVCNQAPDPIHHGPKASLLRSVEFDSGSTKSARVRRRFYKTRNDSFTSSDSGGSTDIPVKTSPKKLNETWIIPPRKCAASNFLDQRQSSLSRNIGNGDSVYYLMFVDKIEGIMVEMDNTDGLSTKLSKDVYGNFEAAVLKIKDTFVNYKYKKRSRKPLVVDEDSFMLPTCTDCTFIFTQEEGILFSNENITYWVVGRQRNRHELYVCFRDGTPQSTIDLAFRMGFGLKV